ncbi:MAG: 16S rRNA (cytosine(967)-C(5))-methyltransferase, partial [Chromatiaceae bacterium]
VCAAPGGKTAHLLELADGQLELTALDIDPQRLDRVRDNLQRLSLDATLLVGDATEPAGAWAQGTYDRILLDVPCSATGVIRRHPDIKWLRRPGDIEALCARQARMLEAIWPLLAPGGTLVYVTCSLLPDENERQIRAFLSRHGDASEAPIAVDWGLARTSGRQTLPTVGGGDGFYFARLYKATP